VELLLEFGATLWAVDLNALYHLVARDTSVATTKDAMELEYLFQMLNSHAENKHLMDVPIWYDVRSPHCPVSMMLRAKLGAGFGENSLDPSRVDAGVKEQVVLDVLIWTCLVGRVELAKLLWEHMYSPIEAALIAASVFKMLSQEKDYPRFKSEDKARMKSCANEFEKLAVQLLDQCCCNNIDTTQLALQEQWLDTSLTVVDIAYTPNGGHALSTVDEHWSRNTPKPGGTDCTSRATSAKKMKFAVFLVALHSKRRRWSSTYIRATRKEKRAVISLLARAAFPS
jgi:hypothetical protein